MIPGTADSFRGYSPPIAISLEIGGQALAVAQVGPDFLVLRTPAELPPTRAWLIVNVDGDPIRQEITLPQGIRIGERRHPIVLVEGHSSLAKAG
jgi:hypothetical protein